MKILLQILCLLFLITSMRAQAPGYQGKKVFIEAGMSFLPTLRGPTAGNKGLGHNGTFAFSTRFRVGTYLTISRKHNLRLTYDYALTGLHRGKYEGDYNTNHSNYNDLFYKFSVHTVSLGIDLYMNNHSIAPLGLYASPTLSIIHSKGVLDTKHSNLTYSVLTSDLVTPTKIDVAMGMQFGYRNILFNRVTFNLAVENHLLVSALASFLGFGSEYGQEVLGRLQNHYFFNFHVGIGMLLF